MDDNERIPDKFKALLELEDELKTDNFGEVINPLIEGAKKHKGTTDDPIPFPHIEYSETVCKFIHAVYDFNKANPDYVNRMISVLLGYAG